MKSESGEYSIEEKHTWCKVKYITCFGRSNENVKVICLQIQSMQNRSTTDIYCVQSSFYNASLCIDIILCQWNRMIEPSCPYMGNGGSRTLSEAGSETSKLEYSVGILEFSEHARTHSQSIESE